MKHIDNDRLHQFAVEAIELTEAENIHIDDCATCSKRLVIAVKLVLLGAPNTDETCLIN
jgi:hypothetical protein